VGITDGGLNVLPDLEKKKQILENAIEVMHSLGMQCPKMAIMSATEVVSNSLPSTVDAQALVAMCAAGSFGNVGGIRSRSTRLRALEIGGGCQGNQACSRWICGLHGGAQH
jgi:hypothetical protein